MWFSRKSARAILTEADIMLQAQAADKWEAIRLVGNRLVEAGHVDPAYVDAMIQREKEFTTYLGNGLAVPHGVGAAKRYIRSSGLSIAQFPNGLDFGEGNIAYLVIGLAGKGDEHIDLLSNIAVRCQDPALVQQLAHETSAARILAALS